MIVTDVDPLVVVKALVKVVVLLLQPMDQQLSRSRLQALMELAKGILFFWIILLLSPILILALVILTIIISWSQPYQPQQRLRSRWDQQNPDQELQPPEE